MKCFLAITTLLVATGMNVGARTYSTSFPLTENPISEGGQWINGATTGLDWFNVETAAGKAYGNVTTGSYTDPTATLAGNWGPDQDATAVVYSNDPNGTLYQEVELRLRTTIAAHSVTGYEVNFRCLKTGAAYAQIVRWNGPAANFTYTDGSCSGAACGVATGDVVRATITGNVIKAYVNGNLVAQATDTMYTTGNPGIGFNYGVGTTNADFGFTSYTATDGMASTFRDSPKLNRNQKLSRCCLIYSRPASSGLSIRFAGVSENDGRMDVRIFSLWGREIRRVYQGPEVNQVEWDGKDESKNAVSDGFYIVKYRYQGLTGSGRVLLVR